MEFINLSSTASTLLITLCSRANMSKKKLILNDEKAEEIMQLTGYSKKKLKLKQSYQIFLTIRAKLIDDYTKEFIAKHNGNCTIIQIACGLDSRYLRINDPRIKWYDLDLYGTMELRKKFYKQTSYYKMIESNVCNFTWINKIDDADLNKPTLIICEGLFMYLSEEDNRHIFEFLGKTFKKSEIIFDVFSPFVVKISKYIHTLKRTKASFKFGFKNPKTIEDFSPNFTHKKTFSYNKNAYIKELPFINRLQRYRNKIFIDKSSRLEIYKIN